MIFLFLYFSFTRSYRSINFEDYTEVVDVISIKQEKIYSLPDFYSTKQKLDRIIFEVSYRYKGEQYNSKSIIYWEFLPPSLERIIDKKDWAKLEVRCKQKYPDEVMIFEAVQ